MVYNLLSCLQPPKHLPHNLPFDWTDFPVEDQLKALLVGFYSHLTAYTNLDVGRVGVDCVDEGALVSAAECIGARVLHYLQAGPEGREGKSNQESYSGLKTRLPGGRCQDG